MKCPVCEKENQTSRVYADDGGIVTLVGYCPYYDEDGKYHSHDPNVMTSTYTCSNRHYFQIKRSNKCWCGWNKEKEDEVTILDNSQSPWGIITISNDQ